MTARKVEATSKVKILGEVEATWEIQSGIGPQAHVTRSTAECFVNVPLGKDILQELQLRFHLKPYKNYQELLLQFCEKRNDFVSRDIICSCNTCKAIPITENTDFPVDFLPESNARSSGYSLLVDVLNNPKEKKLALLVSGKRFGDKNSSEAEIAKNILVTWGEYDKNEIEVIDNFWPMVKWTGDGKGKIENCRFTNTDNDSDTGFILTVKAFQIDTSGTDVPSVYNRNNSDKFVVTGKSDVVLKCSDGMVINAHKRFLTAKSKYFQGKLETNDELLLDFSGEPLLLLLHWMYTGKMNLIPAHAYPLLEMFCITAKELEMNAEFWKWLEDNVDLFFYEDHVLDFERIVQEYDLISNSSVMNKIEYIKAKTTSDQKWEFNGKWRQCEYLLEHVPYLKVEFCTDDKHLAKDTALYSPEVDGAVSSCII